MKIYIDEILTLLRARGEITENKYYYESIKIDKSSDINW